MKFNFFNDLTSVEVKTLCRIRLNHVSHPRTPSVSSIFITWLTGFPGTYRRLLHMLYPDRHRPGSSVAMSGGISHVTTKLSNFYNCFSRTSQYTHTRPRKFPLYQTPLFHAMSTEMNPEIHPESNEASPHLRIANL
jgi:hypothetical protein